MAARPSGAAAGAGTLSESTSMADKIVGMEVGDPTRGVPVRYKDMGDATFALVVSASGGGGGGGGAVTAASGAFVDGSIVTIGTEADTAATSDAATGTLMAFTKRISARLTAVITALGTPFQAGGALGAGTAIIGKFGVDQTTPGTTNGVQINAVTAATTASSTAYETSHIGKASAGTLFAVSIYNSATFAQFYQLHDAASLPANTAVPKSIIRIPAQGTGGWDFGLRGRPFATGIVIANSSTGPTLTIGAADSFYDAVVA